MSDLKDKEVMALLLMREDLSSEIDKYKFVIHMDIYRALLYKKLISMSYAQGWKYKKKFKPKYDKLVLEWIPIEAIRLCISSKFLLEVYGNYYNDLCNTQQTFKIRMLQELINDRNIIDQKEITKMYKKYKVREEQVTLF